MLKLNINGKRIKIPSSFNEINLEKGMEIMDIITKENLTLNDKILIISILTGFNLSFVKEFEESTIDLIYSKLNLEVENTELLYFPVFKLSKTKFGLLNLDKITLHEWETIQFLLNNNDNIFKCLDLLCCIFFRPIEQYNKSFKNILFNIILNIFYKNLVPLQLKSYVVEDLKEDHFKYKDLFRIKLSFNFGLSVVNFIGNLNLKYKDEYPQLYYNETEETNDEEKSEKPKKSFEDIWGFYHIINSISENIFEKDEWRKRDVTEFFKYMCYLKDKNLKEKLETMNNG